MWELENMISKLSCGLKKISQREINNNKQVPNSVLKSLPWVIDGGQCIPNEEAVVASFSLTFSFATALRLLQISLCAEK